MKDSNLDYDEILDNIYDSKNNNAPKNSDSEDIFGNFDVYDSKDSIIFSDSDSLKEDESKLMSKSIESANENDGFLNSQKIQDIKSRNFKSINNDDSSFDNSKKSFSSNYEKSNKSKKGTNKKLAIGVVIIILIVAICGLFLVNNSQILANGGNINIFKNDEDNNVSNVNVTLDNVNFVLPSGSTIKNQSSSDVYFNYKNSQCYIIEMSADTISGVAENATGLGYYINKISSSSDKVFDVYSFTQASSNISGYLAIFLKNDKYFVLYSYQPGIPAEGNVNSELKEVIDLFNKLN